jgi:Kef-type K+ transport system membrane component KefB
MKTINKIREFIWNGRNIAICNFIVAGSLATLRLYIIGVHGFKFEVSLFADVVIALSSFYIGFMCLKEYNYEQENKKQ